jgi:hypothetical protein
MKKLIPALLAGALLLVGATVALAQTEDSDPSTTATEDGPATGDTFSGHPDRGAILGGVLDDLVTDGTLDRDQADAVIAALEAKQAELLTQRDELRAAWEEAWADDVLTADEAAALAGDGPLGDEITDPDGLLADYWADGQLTRDELAQARQALGIGGRGHHRGRFGDEPDSTPDTEESSFSTPGTPAEAGA